MLQYEFMQKAFIIGVLLSIIIPCIGVVMVLKRLSMIGDALSHTSLAGVALGLLIGINPVIGATVACLCAAAGIEWIRKKMPATAEISIAVIMSAGVGLAGVLSGFTKNTSNFNSFLFGSIVSITNLEMQMVIGISIIVLIGYVFFYKELMYLSFDEESAKLSGVPVKTVNTIFTFMTALTVSIAARTVGALIVSSFMVIPVACAMQFAKSYKQTILYSVVFAVFSTIIGLTLAYYNGLKPGGTIVLTGIVFLVSSIGVKGLFKKGF